jgi:hypothetical protein
VFISLGVHEKRLIRKMEFLRFNQYLKYVGVLVSLWPFLFPIFLFAAQPKEFFLDGLNKLEQRSHKCVDFRGEYEQ